MSINDEEDMKRLHEVKMILSRYYPDIWKLIEERTRLEEEIDVVAVMGKEITPNSVIAAGNIILLDLINREIKDKISKIIRDIESGIPLRGVCETYAEREEAEG